MADSVLMCAPIEIHKAIQAEDHKAAAADANLPSEEYLSSIRERTATKGHPGLAYGGVSDRQEEITIDIEKLTQPQKKESS